MFARWFTTLLCLAASSAAAALSYPLGLSSDGRDLVDATGRPVMLHGDAPWHLLTRLDRDQTLVYLDDRRAKGFDALLMSLLVSDGYSVPNPNNAYGAPPFLVPGDVRTPNEAYFAHVDWAIDQAAQRGFTVILFPFYLGWECGPEGWCAEAQQASVADMRDWGRWLGLRYRDRPNLIWIHGGDVDASLFGVMDKVDAVAEGILEVDANHLHIAHCARYASGASCYDRPWLDFETVYTDCDGTPAATRDAYYAPTTRPAIYLEGFYEFENGAGAECMRRQAYQSVLGGAVGHFFGSGWIWDFPWQWEDGIHSEGSTSMAVFGALMRARDWQHLVPDYDHVAVTAGYGSIADGGYASAARTVDRNSLLVYLPYPRTITVAMDQIAGERAEAWWIDPVGGGGELIGVFPTSGSRDFTPTAGGDRLLVIDNADAPFVDVWNGPTATEPAAPRVRLHDAAPNPFNPRTQIVFEAPAGAPTTIGAFDARGRRLAEVFRGVAAGGVQTVTWDATGLASGVYHLRLTAAGRTETRRVALIR